MLIASARVAIVALAVLALAACQAPAGQPAAKAPAPSAPAAGAPAAQQAVPAAPAQPAAAAPAAPARATVEIGRLPGAAFQWPLYAALDKGFFAGQALDPEEVQISTPNDAARAAVSRSVSVAHFSVDAAVRAIEAGGDLVVVGSEIANPAFSLIVQPELRDYAQLRGKSFAVSTPKDGAAVVLRLMFRAKGLGETDYDFLPVGTTPNRYAALKSRQADGAIMTQPLDFVAIDDGFHLLGRSTDVIQHYMFMSVSANRTWAREQRPVLVRYLRALADAVAWLYNPANKDEAIDLLATRTNTERTAVSRTYGVYIEEGKVIPERAQVPVEGLRAMLETLIELGDLPGPTVDPQRYIDLSYGQEAQRP
jgi:ABC-type nitrate/sulfonate/bicarbonate transport system substrate-binding protein